MEIFVSIEFQQCIVFVIIYKNFYLEIGALALAKSWYC